MQPLSLNILAIGVFAMTMFALIAPIFNIPVIYPAGVTLTVMGLLTVDTLAWENRGVTLFLDLFSTAKQRERVLHHEAGHFLVAYFLGIPITGYSLTAWEAFRQKQPGNGGVQFDTTPLENSGTQPNQINLMLDRFCTVWCAGIAAEILYYGQAEGGADDRAQLQLVLSELGYPQSQRQQKEDWAKLQAKSLLERHEETYQALVKVMRQRASVETCEQIIQYNSQLQA
ncbi:ATP-dependent Zn protease [Euhalothece natronophila Z-M001]|uniref:ATP-dependent Zn protease n=1 Tax=Euhalothece natronophila Z-M001 TaxID=522448 RepID=A0A5B8NQ15_9CHRO|nr:ATP-dependent Zn protease [Euhalothece natronophila]QDZ41104.1 ATP-dependent Zn protease [Euhalothece natronophila Z-M001]